MKQDSDPVEAPAVVASEDSATDETTEAPAADPLAADEETTEADTGETEFALAEGELVDLNLTVNEQDAAPEVEGKRRKEPYKGYFEMPHYVAYDYSLPPHPTLPGPDFNKQVYEFNMKNQIWSDSDYAERVNTEAQIMVALEALKTSVNYLHASISELQSSIKGQYLGLTSVVYDDDFHVAHGQFVKISQRVG